jgi:hypothetical protein
MSTYKNGKQTAYGDRIVIVETPNDPSLFKLWKIYTVRSVHNVQDDWISLNNGYGIYPKYALHVDDLTPEQKEQIGKMPKINKRVVRD